MSDEITNQPQVGTQEAPNAATEENTNQGQTQVTEQQQGQQDPGENSNGENGTTDDGGDSEEGKEQEGGDKQPTIEELQAKISQYELREEEDKMLRERLGIQDVDQQTYNYMNIDQQIVNEGKQVYLRLCNEYGIDANPRINEDRSG